MKEALACPSRGVMPPGLPGLPPWWVPVSLASKTKGLRGMGDLFRPEAMSPTTEEEAGSLGKVHNLTQDPFLPQHLYNWKGLSTVRQPEGSCTGHTAT